MQSFGGERDVKSLLEVGINGRVILKWIFKQGDGELQTGLIWLRIGTGRRRCECGNEPSGSMKCKEFLD